MSRPSRPHKHEEQGPATRCVINGKEMGWLNCTCASCAMGISRTTLNVRNPTACTIRRGTHDTIGGTTLPQVCSVAKAQFGINGIEIRVGRNIAAPSYVARQLRAGRGVIVQGNTRALIGTKYRSTGGGVNHAVWVNEVRGTDVGGDPLEALVYDPAADGRTSSWGKADQGPSWWPWSLVKKFAAYLRPAGDNDPNILGAGKMYCAIFPDTEPHAHYRYGGKKTTPFPDKTRGSNPEPGQRASAIRARPTAASSIVASLRDGEVFEAFQKTETGQSVNGSKVWFGNHDGTQWVHESRLRYEGGST